MKHHLSNRKQSIYERSMFSMGLIMLLSELGKQYILTYQIYKGTYNVWYLPFQLCSIPMYLCLLLPLVNVRFKRRIQVFLMTFSLLGGVAAFVDTSGMQYPITILTWHSYLWHLLIILMGIWSGILWCQEYKPATRAWKDFFSCLPIWFFCLGLATLFNLILWQYGEINMFYISPMEPSSQIIIHQLAMKIGIHGSNLCYLLAMLTGAEILMCLWKRIAPKV